MSEVREREAEWFKRLQSPLCRVGGGKATRVGVTSTKYTETSRSVSVSHKRINGESGWTVACCC